MTVSEYRQLKQLIITGVGMNSVSKPHLLEELKTYYQREINSRRRFEDICTVTKLLSVLEIRDVLSEENVEPLKEIARRLSNSDDLLRRISEYQTMHAPRECYNYYAAGSLNSHIREHASTVNSHPYGYGVSRATVMRIRDIIVEQIGICWKDLGRNLTDEIRECDLDKIDSNNDSLEAKAFELMLLYERKAHPDRGIMNLCRALEKSHRRDLNKLIQEIMTMKF